MIRLVPPLTRVVARVWLTTWAPISSSSPARLAMPVLMSWAALTDSLPPRLLRQRAGRPHPAGPGALEPALQRLGQLGVHLDMANIAVCRNPEGGLASRMLAVAGIDPSRTPLPSFGDYTA